MAKRTSVGPEAVRTFAREKGMEGKFTAEKARGRLPKALIESYEAETGNKVVTGFKPAAKVTLRVTKVDKNGKARTRPVQKTLAEVREVPGIPARGVLSAKSITLAEAHFSDEVPASE